MTAFVRMIMTALELMLAVPMRILRFALTAVINPRLGPLRYVFGAAAFYTAFALVLVYVVAPIRGYSGRAYLGESIRYSAERWLATAIYDSAGNFVGTLDPRLDSLRDVNYTGRAIEHGDYVAHPDHKSIPVRDVPNHYWQCLVHHEDRHLRGWLNPFGIDITGVLKIPASTIKRSIEARRVRLGVGGSTLPMQLARTYYKTPPRRDESAAEKLGRKFREWWIAPVIQAELTRGGDLTHLKQWAANHLPLAQRAGGDELNGIELTARVVFGKEAADLSVAEQFVLASAVNRPIILTQGSESLNRVRMSHWRYIIGVRARVCANALLADPKVRAEVSDDLTRMEYGPPDPVVKPKLQTALEEHAPQTAKLAMANPALRANVLIPEVRYGVREEMKNEFGFEWRRHVREVNLTLDVVDNRTFRDKVKAELADLQKRFEGRIAPGFTLDAGQLVGPGAADKRLPNIIIAAANERQEIVRYFEVDDLATYFGSLVARSSENGRYDPERESRRIASIGKMMAAIAIANTGRDTTETPYTDTLAPAIGLESCRKAPAEQALTRARSARVAFACSLNSPIEWRLRQIGQEPMQKLVDRFGFAMPPESASGEGTPPVTAAVRGLVAGSPQRVHRMAAVTLAALTGQSTRKVGLPSLVRRYDLSTERDEPESVANTAVSHASVVKPHAVPLLKALLQAPLCYRAGDVRHGTLKSLSHWCAETRPDLRLHFAKTGTDVTADPDATVDTWVAGGIQFATGRAYSYVVLVGSGDVSRPWARKIHASDVAAPLVDLLLQDLAQMNVPPSSATRVAVAAPVAPATTRKPSSMAAPVAQPQPPAPVASVPVLESATSAVPGGSGRERVTRPVQAAASVKPRKPWMLDEATRRMIFNGAGS